MKSQGSKSWKSGIPYNDLEELANKRAVSDIKEYILAAPDVPWEHSTNPKDAIISFNVEFKGAKDQQQYIQWLMREVKHLDTQCMKGSMNVVLSKKNSRVECNGESIHGENFIYITDKKSGFIFINKANKTYLHLLNENKVRHDFNEKITSKTNIISKGKNGSATAEIIVESPYKLKYILELDTEEKWLPFSHDIICMLIGCPDQFKEAGIDLQPVANLGIPVKGEVFMQQNNQMWQKMSSFKLSDISSYQGKDNPFDIPPGYKDLRTISKKGKKYTFGPAIRLSDYRRNISKNPCPCVLNTAPRINQPAATGTQIDNTNNYRYSSGALYPPEINFPLCLPETYGNLLANILDEKLLDDIKYFANGISKRLTSFNGDNGILTINWMDQFKAYSDPLGPNDPGGGLYNLLHDEHPTNASHPQKLGMLDKLAAVSLSKLLATGDNLSSLLLPPVLQTDINNIISNSYIPPAQRFSHISTEKQGLLIDAYVFKGIGKIDLAYPSTTGTQSIFYDLLNVRLENIKFDININNTDVIRKLVIGDDSIILRIKLPDASGEAWLSRWPTARYWFYVGLSGIICFLAPFTCFLMEMAVLVTLFISLDLAFVTLELADFEIDSHIRLVPNASNILQAEVDLTLDANVSAFYMSVIPTGVHQIVSLIYDIVLNTTDLVINSIESQLRDKIKAYLLNDLKITYPPVIGPVNIVGISNAVEYQNDDFTYIEESLRTGPQVLINPYVTQIDSQVKPSMKSLRNHFKDYFKDPVDAYANSGLLNWVTADLSKVARFYIGTVLSQNLINNYVYSLWCRFIFNYDFSTEESGDLFSLLKTAFPTFNNIKIKQVFVHLWPAVPPRTLLTPKPASEGNYYATTIFDDIRICFQLIHDDKRFPPIMEFAFAGEVTTELGFGGYNPAIGKLDLLTLTDSIFDIYFNLKDVNTNIIHPEVQFFAFPGMSPKADYDYSPLDILQDMLRRGFVYSLARRSNISIPRNSNDPIYIQRYPLGNDSLQVIFQLIPFRGNLYICKGFGGIATAAYEGALDIDNISKVAADLICIFSQ